MINFLMIMACVWSASSILPKGLWVGYVPVLPGRYCALKDIGPAILPYGKPNNGKSKDQNE